LRHLAALVLAFGDGGAGVPQLLAALDGDDPRALEAASSVLTELLCTGAVREEEAFERVRGLAVSIDPAVRRHAVRALVLFEEEEPVRELLAAGLSDSDPGVAAAAREVRDILDEVG
jgi:HEAT repeat protein